MSKLMRSLVYLAGSALITAPLHAIQDSNNNGLSDVWEKFYNNNQLFPAASPYLPGDDPDSDGWANSDEAVAGSNPFSAALPEGWVRTTIQAHPEADGCFLLSWPSMMGKAYRLSVSTNLVDWADFGEVMAGTGSEIALALDCEYEEGGTPERMFWRVRIEDADPDGDGLTTWEELALQTDPYHPDTDRDGIFDNVDVDPLISATLADPDGMGLPASLDNELIGRWDFESLDGSAKLASTPQSVGGLDIASTVASWDGSTTWAQGPTGMPSRCMHFHPFGPPAEIQPTAYGKLPAAKFSGWNTQTWSMWIQFPRDGLKDLAKRRTIFALGAFEGALDATQNPHIHCYLEPGTTTARSDDRIKIDTYWLSGANYAQTNLASWPVPAGLDDGKWHHISVAFGGGSYRLYLDGQQHSITSSNSVNMVLLQPGGTPWCYIGRFRPSVPSGVYQSLGVRLDRLRVHRRFLTSAEILALARQDIDSDGLWDVTEATTSLWRDANSDGQRSSGELHFISSPFEWQFAHTDSDGDEAIDIEEQTAGTLIGRADTDGDLLPDGWELLHGLNPKVSNATDLNGNGTFEDSEYTNSDTDSLTDIVEFRHNTNPKSSNTDGGDPGNPDNVDDGTEIGQGSNPNDPKDGGLAPDPDEMVSIKLGIGDQSGSESEDYVMHCYRLDPETGIETRVYTLRNGGYGKYEEKTVGNVFRRGESYTYQIKWQGSKQTSQSASGGQSAEGPDFDYTFKVEPQTADAGVVVDSWDTKTRTVNTGSALRAEDAQDVAASPGSFKEDYERKRVAFVSLQLRSVDRFVAGVVDLPQGFAGLELSITNETTSQDFGSHGYLDGSGDTKVYEEYEGMLGWEDNNGQGVVDPRVWFVKDPLQRSRTMFYLVSGSPGADYGTVKVEAKWQGVLLGTVRVAMSPVPGMDALLRTTIGIAGGTHGAGFPGLQPVVINAPESWSAAALASLYPFLYQVESVSILFKAMLDGVVGGLKDDWEFAQLIGAGTVLAGDWLKARLEAAVNAWINDPMGRLREARDFLKRTVEDFIAERFGGVPTLDSLPEYLHRFWKSGGGPLPDPDEMWANMVDGIVSWFEELADRHFAEAERLSWLESPFPKASLLNEAAANFTAFCYNTGFVFGYLCEQVAVGVATEGAFTVAKVAAKAGLQAIGRLSVRTAASVAVRLAWVKVIVRDSGIADPLLKAAVERGFALAVVQPVADTTIKKCTFEILEAMFSRQGFNRATYNFQKYVDDLLSGSNLKMFLVQPGKEVIIHKRAAQLATILGNDCNETVIKNFVKVMDDQLLVLRPDGTVDEYFEGFFRAFQGNPALMVDLDDPAKAIASLSPDGRETLKKFLSDPNAGKLWEIDVPAIVDSEPAVPHNYWVRGILGELDIYKRVYQPAGYTHAPTAAAFDFTGPKWVQIKTLKNPDGAFQAMKKAVDDLIQHSPADKPLRLHILKKPESSSQQVEAQLRAYIDDPNGPIQGRVELIIQEFELVP